MFSLFEDKLCTNRDPGALTAEMEEPWHEGCPSPCPSNSSHWYTLPMNPNGAKEPFSIEDSRLILSVDKRLYTKYE